MTSTQFYKLVLALWGEEWRSGLRNLLKDHGIKRSRQTFWNWQHGEVEIPEEVGVILESEKKRRKTVN